MLVCAELIVGARLGRPVLLLTSIQHLLLRSFSSCGSQHRTFAVAETTSRALNMALGCAAQPQCRSCIRCSKGLNFLPPLHALDHKKTQLSPPSVLVMAASLCLTRAILYAKLLIFKMLLCRLVIRVGLQFLPTLG